jgi:hypothetical protein
MGGLLGALAGGTTGAVLMVVTAIVDTDVTFSDRGTVPAVLGAVVPLLLIGLFFGAIAGLVVGLVVGVEMMFLVGSHLPREVARPRAYALGFVLPPTTILAVVLVPTVINGAQVSVSASGALWWVIALGGGSLLGGPLARWLAGFQPPRPQPEGP